MYIAHMNFLCLSAQVIFRRIRFSRKKSLDKKWWRLRLQMSQYIIIVRICAFQPHKAPWQQQLTQPSYLEHQLCANKVIYKEHVFSHRAILIYGGSRRGWRVFRRPQPQHSVLHIYVVSLRVIMVYLCTVLHRYFIKICLFCPILAEKYITCINWPSTYMQAEQFKEICICHYYTNVSLFIVIYFPDKYLEYESFI